MYMRSNTIRCGPKLAARIEGFLANHREHPVQRILVSTPQVFQACLLVGLVTLRRMMGQRRNPKLNSLPVMGDGRILVNLIESFLEVRMPPFGLTFRQKTHKRIMSHRIEPSLSSHRTLVYLLKSSKTKI